MSMPSCRGENACFYVNPDYLPILEKNGICSAGELLSYESSPVKSELEERYTSRAVLRDGDSTELEVFIKRFKPVSLGERFKNLTSFRPFYPDGALHEWNSLNAMRNLGIPAPVPVAAAKQGAASCVMTLGLGEYIRASDLFEALREKTDLNRKRKLIYSIADIVGRMHAAKFAHQDCYLLHFFVIEDEEDAVFLIDWQRTVAPESFSKRWRVKDLAQLHFSSSRLLSERDMMRFCLKYAESASIGVNSAKQLAAPVFAKSARIRKRAERKK